MSVTSSNISAAKSFGGFFSWGMLALIAATIGAGFFFADGIDALLTAWQVPEYSHGPLIPVLSALLFLRQLKEFPERPGAIPDRWPGVVLLVFALLIGALGQLSNISDIVAYALILWVGAILLISFGWSTGKHFWPPVLHLVYMLPLPGVIYYKMSTGLQFVSSELGVWFLQQLNVPVFLDGNIIDLGVLKLHVAEACSGLRYLFPILSFSYIFAVLYRGPMWHKAVLLVSAVPITILMNSVRIAVAGVLAQRYGLDWLEGFTHFFEGWVIFLACIILLFLLARIMLFFHPTKMGLIDALDLDTDGLVPQAMRLRLVRASKAMITAAVLMVGAAGLWTLVPDDRAIGAMDRDSFAVFPRSFGDWRQEGPPILLKPRVAKTLKADDYHQVNLVRDANSPAVGLFMAWYRNQGNGGVHSPEICLPGAGWEIAWLERTDIAAQVGSETEFNINRAIIQKGETRMMVYYWFEQKGRRIAWDFAAKFYLMVDGIMTGRVDGGIVRLTTLITPNETDADAEARLNEVLLGVVEPLPRFMPKT
ncbi:exosortase D (VPLPA-CTERM-specific) [Litoreibacter meonggei]|uniref:Exosortase D (VPLPA-CTERM-specific) n=1 Tax=Litoreibacter meonggei TaxID=1049199 RepID=A0A497VDH3_9RHOB|nr:VPLPA-CTERM-specific exosortase XrtD [Litoreibacter meonggei]RLJ36219.1 exosortase D (VPLPA-CTERM-specific) [Litoreibacter meonggei]